MVRKREKFRKGRESPRLSASAILVITAVIVIVFMLALFSTGLIQSFFSGSSPSTLTVSAVNSLTNVIPQNTLYYDYTEYPTIAASNYTQQWIYVQGNVSSVENQGGNYRSCVDPSEPYLYGCSYASEMAGWIIWTWSGPSQAAKVPVDTDFVAECYVIGMSGGELNLNPCMIVQS